MSPSKPKNTNESEEIHLGALFNSIVRGISRLFHAIGSAILFVPNTLLDLTVFVRQSIVYYGSNNSLETESTLAPGLLGQTGVVPTYAITQKILEK